MNQNQTPTKTIDQYYEISETHTKNYMTMPTAEWRKQSEVIAQEFYQDFFKFELSLTHAKVLARCIVSLNPDQKLKVIEYVFNLIRKPNFNMDLQNAYGGILSVVCNSYHDRQIKDLLKIKKEEFTGRYQVQFVDLIRRYSL